MTNGADFALLEQYIFRHRWIDKNHRNVIMMNILSKFRKNRENLMLMRWNFSYILIFSGGGKRRMNYDFFNFSFDHCIRPGRRPHTYFTPHFLRDIFTWAKIRDFLASCFELALNY